MYTLLETSSLKDILSLKTDSKIDPVTEDVMKYFVMICQTSTHIKGHSSICFNSSFPPLVLQQNLKTIFSHNVHCRKFFVGNLREDKNNWFAYLIDFIPKKKVIEIHYCGWCKYTQHIKSGMEFVLKDFCKDNDISHIPEVKVSLNQVLNFGVKCGNAARSTQQTLQSFYIIYFIINHSGSTDVEVHDRTIESLKYHLVFLLLTGEPYYSISDKFRVNLNV